MMTKVEMLQTQLVSLLIPNLFNRQPCKSFHQTILCIIVVLSLSADQPVIVKVNVMFLFLLEFEFGSTDDLSVQANVDLIGRKLFLLRLYRCKKLSSARGLIVFIIIIIIIISLY